MLYILGILLKNNSNALQGISQLCGVGIHMTKLIFNELNIGLSCKIRNLTQSIVGKMLKWIETNKILINNYLKHKPKIKQ